MIEAIENVDYMVLDFFVWRNNILAISAALTSDA